MTLNLPWASVKKADGSINPEAVQADIDEIVKAMPTVPRVIAGLINTSGPVTTGTGFTVVRNGVGSVTITFTVPFAGQPSVVATPCETSGAIAIKGADGIPFTASSARFQAFSPDAPFASVETIFSFVAVGT